MGGSTNQMEVNHAFGLGSEMGEWCGGTSAKILAHKFGESKPSHSHTDPLKELPPGQGPQVVIDWMVGWLHQSFSLG